MNAAVMNDTFELAKLIQQDRLIRSAKSRLVRALIQESPSPAMRLRQRLGNLLIVAGNRLKAYPADRYIALN